MPRIGRVIVANMPCHIVQRGHNRNAVFVDQSDYRYYLDTLQEWSQALDVAVLSWCLMTNHVHLLVDPGNNIKSIGLLMKRLAGRQTRFVNCQERRTGSLWDGRYKLSIVDSDAYFLATCRYIELNPVKAGMVSAPEYYQWSSYRENIGLEGESYVNRARFQQFTNVRRSEYIEFIRAGVDELEQQFISKQVESNLLTGSSRFVEEIELRTGIRVEHKKPGRPRKQCN